jgi:FkbM family methyltransferase
MNKRVWLIRQLGATTLDGDATFTNLAMKKFLGKLRFEKGSRIYEFSKSVYRSVGKVTKIEASYASFGEDRVLSKYLKEMDGSYIDVGAGAPINGSNTYLFYERGWRGVTIDPIISITKLHQKKRPLDKQINACVTDQKDELIEFYQFAADDFSTNSTNRVSELQQIGISPKSKYLVPNISLRDIAHICNPQIPTLLNIDVEGGELNVLKSNNWDVCKPRVIAVEEWHSPIYSKTEVRMYLESLDYRLTSRCFLTSIYVHLNFLQSISDKNEQNVSWFRH